jgi:aerobic-type carbon monoxide dehydrogenase small subunit (CoxS/CutS family)
MSSELRNIELTVNGTPHGVEVDVRTSLADLLRHRLGYTGTHVGCEHGACGACTVLVDGVAVRACLMLAPQADGCEVETVESLASDGRLHPLQEGFRRRHGLQCGFCTPGILMAMVGAARGGDSLEDVLERVLPGHLCRCTGYVNIRQAIRDAWDELDHAEREGSEVPGR